MGNPQLPQLPNYFPKCYAVLVQNICLRFYPECTGIDVSNKATWNTAIYGTDHPVPYLRYLNFFSIIVQGYDVFLFIYVLSSDLAHLCVLIFRVHA